MHSGIKLSGFTTMYLSILTINFLEIQIVNLPYVKE